ncbi:unnamed protein product, partial [Prorocentrum cordatum]
MDVAAGLAPLLNALLHVGHFYDWGRQTGPVCPDCPDLVCPALPVIPECPRCAECPARTCPPVAPCEAPSVSGSRLQKIEDLIEVLVEKFPKASPSCTPCEAHQREPDESCFHIGVRLFTLGVSVGVFVSLTIYLPSRCCCCRQTALRVVGAEGRSVLPSALAVQDVETPASRRWIWSAPDFSVRAIDITDRNVVLGLLPLARNAPFPQGPNVYAFDSPIAALDLGCARAEAGVLAEIAGGAGAAPVVRDGEAAPDGAAVLVYADPSTRFFGEELDDAIQGDPELSDRRTSFSLVKRGGERTAAEIL